MKTRPLTRSRGICDEFKNKAERKKPLQQEYLSFQTAAENLQLWSPISSPIIAYTSEPMVCLFALDHTGCHWVAKESTLWPALTMAELSPRSAAQVRRKLRSHWRGSGGTKPHHSHFPIRTPLGAHCHL